MSGPDDIDLVSTDVILDGKPKFRQDQTTQLQLVVIGVESFSTHALPKIGSYSIGRSSSCNVLIDENSISRRHAILEIGEKLTIADLGSVNGTIVRGQKLEARTPTTIGVGELIGLGHVNVIVQQRSRAIRPRRLMTHDYFDTRLDEECARVGRTGSSFTLMHFEAQRHVPQPFVEQALAELLRESDVVGKFGAHEYHVLMPDTAPANADDALRRLGAALVERGIHCRITLACCPRDGRTTYELMSKVKQLETASSPASDIVVLDAKMQALHRLVEQVAGAQIGVLLLGETGVGKEVFARALHAASPRAAGPFVEVNCAALTESLLESELFGHEKGAFTHATAAKPGLIESAHGGTLLLDEIGDMPIATQAKLLRVIEDAQLRRVGGIKSKAIDVRFVAATNSDLESEIGRGRFRRDLFFRINGVTIVIPPLRERIAEVEPLAYQFIRRVWTARSAPPEITAAALATMKEYSWPGNIRELKHAIERAVLICGGGPITPEHLLVERMRGMIAARPEARAVTIVVPEPRLVPPPKTPTAMPVRGSPEEAQWIMRALEDAGGNQTLAARALGISRRTLVNRLNEYKDVRRPRKDKKS